MAPVTLSTKALVISSMAMGESDLLITLFTAETGKLRAVAKGAKKSTKRFMNALEPFTQISVSLARGRPSGLWRLDSATILDIHEAITSDYKRFIYASLCMELTDMWHKEGVRDMEVFRLLRWYLSAMSLGVSPVKYSLIFKIRLLKAVGLLPSLSVCMVCGKQPVSSHVSFDRATGEIICPSCGDKRNGTSLCLGTARSIEFISRASLENVSRLKLTGEQVLECWSFMKQLHCRHLRREPSSYRLIDVSKDLRGRGHD